MTFSTTITLDEATRKTVDTILYDGGKLFTGEAITRTATFNNGFQMDIKCCGSDEGNCWCEAVLVDPEGDEVQTQAGDDEFTGDWECTDRDGNTYQVTVI